VDRLLILSASSVLPLDLSDPVHFEDFKQHTSNRCKNELIILIHTDLSNPLDEARVSRSFLLLPLQQREKVLLDEFGESGLCVLLKCLWEFESRQSENDVQVLSLGNLLNALLVIHFLFYDDTELVQFSRGQRLRLSEDSIQPGVWDEEVSTIN